MQTAVDIAFRHCEPSEEIRSEIAAQVQRLEKFSPRITSCRIVVTGPQTGHRRGGFEVELRIAMPEHNKVVATSPMPTRPSANTRWSRSGRSSTLQCDRSKTSCANFAVR